MKELQEKQESRVLRIGPDEVTVTESKIIVLARHEMPDWEVREFKVPPVYFEDRKYFLAAKNKAQPPFAFRYVLEPWTEGKFQPAAFFHTYDAEAVAARDAARRGSQLNEAVWVLLLPLYPVLGLLWARTQERLTRFGFVPRVMTCVSLFTVFAVGIGEAVFTAVVLNAGARSGIAMVGGFFTAISDQKALHLGPLSVPIGLIDVCLFVTCVADAAVRFTHFMKEDQWTGGFLEWLVPRSWRGK